MRRAAAARVAAARRGMPVLAALAAILGPAQVQPALVVVVAAVLAAAPALTTRAAAAVAWVCWAKDLTGREVRRLAPVAAVGLGAVTGKVHPIVLAPMAALTVAAELGRAPQTIVAAAMEYKARYALSGGRAVPSPQPIQVTCNVV